MNMTIGQQFWVETQLDHIGPSEQVRGLPQPPLELSAGGDEPVIDLPKPAALPHHMIDFDAINLARRTLRTYSAAPLSLEELSFLLWTTQGVENCIGETATQRVVPSAGGRHAFETLLLVNRVDGLEAGLYRFRAIGHELLRLPAPSDIIEQIVEDTVKQKHAGSSAVTFIWIAVMARMVYRYGERGWRYLLLDAGHVCQNLILAAEIIDCGVCPIAKFDDEKLNRTLGLDGVDQFAVYLGAVGKK